MSPHASLNIYPSEVPVNTNITVRTESGYFPEQAYIITDEKGRIIRKGLVSERLNEIRLSLVGLAAGVYYFTMGTANKQFTIVYH